LQKIAATPWKQGKKWINAVYFAHPNDSLESISEKIYGAGKSVDLSKANPQYASRALKPGDKVYYSSPQRPDDQEKVLTYYDDNNIQSQSYTSQSGDTVKKVAKKILGYDGAWKELWASNEIDSKGEIPEGTTLRYWPYDGEKAAAPAPEKLAEAAPAPAPVEPAPAPAPAPEPPVAVSPTPPPAENPTPPPPAPGSDQAAMPPPPPPVDTAPPPPPGVDTAGVPPASPTPGEHGAEPGTTSEEDPMVYAVLGLAGLAVVALIMIKKKRKQKELEQALNDTQVG
jgi:hypothetical protein